MFNIPPSSLSNPPFLPPEISTSNQVLFTVVVIHLFGEDCEGGLGEEGGAEEDYDGCIVYPF